MNVRKTALRLVMEWEERRTYVNITVPGASDKLPPRDKTLLTALVYGTVERLITLDYFIGAFSARSPKDLDLYTRCLLRLGLYQVLYFKGIPAHAAVNETVNLARNPAERGFVNAILRTAVRRRQDLPMPPRDKNLARYLSVRYSVPLWIVKRFLSDFDDETEALLDAFDRRPPLTLAVNTMKISREEFLAKLAEGGIYAAPTPYAPRGVQLAESTSPKSLPGFEEGWFWVQDEASQLAVAALGAEAGETVLDLCACPGGKSFGAAVDMKDSGRVCSFDLHESKLPLVISGAERLGLESLSVAQHDATVPMEDWVGRADRVICDVPCSGLGVLAKKPDLRYRAEEGVLTLPLLQYAILENAASYVKAGGVLLYSTCTLSRAENQETVARFLAEHGEFAPEDFSFGEPESKGGMLLLTPHKHRTDGFFLCKMRKREM